MEDLEMQHAFLGYLYNKNFSGDEPTLDSVDKWIKQNKLDRNILWKQYERMIKEGLIKFVQDEGTIRLTPRGTLKTEKLGLVSAQHIAINRDARKRLMVAMADHLDGTGSNMSVKDLVKAAELELERCNGNILLMISLGYARWQVPYETLTINAKVCSKAEDLVRAA
jgi:hypothetical protein